ncbi:MAG: hypothetical protein KC478_02760 [Bacteriovoracaceae bacterium]|nr:hypothetical protein [Bacteriovoracaceae bacterium]
MKNFNRLLTITICALAFGCTEEVAEELKNSSSSAQSSTAEEKSIRLEHEMSDELSFYLHKGGDSDKPCELKAPTGGFNATNYSRSSDVYTQDCVLEVGELDLYSNGAKFKFEGDGDMCEYYTYTPLRFLERPIGNSQKIVYEISCDDDDCSSLCGTLWEDYDNGGGSGTGTDSSHLSGQLFEAPTCKYDYTDDEDYAKNCDEGTITTVKLELDASDESVDPAVCRAAPFTATKIEQSTADCGGDHLSCMGGPSVDFFESPTNVTMIYDNLSLSAFSQSFEVEAPLERNSDNRYIANFSRYMANGTTVCEPGATDIWSSDFEGDNIETFRSTGFSPIGATTFQLNASGTELLAGEELDAIAYAENPFRSAYYTTATYSFKCLDDAFDTKAQIRLFIREWDRKYPTNSNAIMEYISDHDAATKYIDSDQVNTDSENWNTVRDWDDFFDTAGVFHATQCYETLNYFDAVGGLSSPFPEVKL